MRGLFALGWFGLLAALSWRLYAEAARTVAIDPAGAPYDSFNAARRVLDGQWPGADFAAPGGIGIAWIHGLTAFAGGGRLGDFLAVSAGLAPFVVAVALLGLLRLCIFDRRIWWTAALGLAPVAIAAPALWPGPWWNGLGLGLGMVLPLVWAFFARPMLRELIDGSWPRLNLVALAGLAGLLTLWHPVHGPALLIACAVGVPLMLWVGHGRRPWRRVAGFWLMLPAGAVGAAWLATRGRPAAAFAAPPPAWQGYDGSALPWLQPLDILLAWPIWLGLAALAALGLALYRAYPTDRPRFALVFVMTLAALLGALPDASAGDARAWLPLLPVSAAGLMMAFAALRRFYPGAPLPRLVPLAALGLAGWLVWPAVTAEPPKPPARLPALAATPAPPIPEAQALAARLKGRAVLSTHAGVIEDLGGRFNPGGIDRPTPDLAPRFRAVLAETRPDTVLTLADPGPRDWPVLRDLLPGWRQSAPAAGHGVWRRRQAAIPARPLDCAVTEAEGGWLVQAGDAPAGWIDVELTYRAARSGFALRPLVVLHDGDAVTGLPPEGPVFAGLRRGESLRLTIEGGRLQDLSCAARWIAPLD